MVIHAMQTIAPRGNFTTVEAVPITSNPLVGERAGDVSDYLGYYFRNRMNLSEAYERYVRSFVLFGNAFGKVWWKRVRRKARTIERVPAFIEEVDPVTGETIENKISSKKSVEVYFENKEVIRKSKKDGKYTVWNPVEKREVEYAVEHRYNEDSRENEILITSYDTIDNQPQFDFIDMDDIYFDLSAPSINDSKSVAIRYSKTFSEIKAGWNSGRWGHLRAEDIEEMEERANKTESIGDEPLELTPRTNLDTGQKLRQEQDDSEGYVTTRAPTFEVWEVFRRMDLDGDGEEEEIVIWYEAKTKKIMRVEHLSVEYHSNERPLVHSTLIPVGNRLLGIGIGEVLLPLLIELNTVFNHRNDAATMSVSPGGFYRPGSGFEPGAIEWKPNAWLPVDNPQVDVVPYSSQSSQRDAINVEQFLLALAEDLSISTFTMGRGPDRPNAPRTARGTMAILQQDAIKLDYILQRLMPSIEDVCHKTLHLLRMNGPESEEFRVIGSKSVKSIRKEDLDEKMDFFFDLDSVSANREVKRQFASMALEAILPLTMQPPEAVSNGARILARRFLEMLEFKNVKEIIPDAPGFERAPISQSEETEVMLQGVHVEPVMADNHMEHIFSMDEFEMSDSFGTVSTEWIETLWKPHKIAHARLEKEKRKIMEAQVGQKVGAQGGAGGMAGGGSVPGGPGMMNPNMGSLGDTGAMAPENPGSTFTGEQEGQPQ